jgi:vancomycin resistance protein VanJ
LIIETRGHADADPDVVADAPPRRPRRLLAIACWGYLLTIVALWLFLRQWGDQWWPATVLLLGPRWPFAAPAVVLWLGVIAARRRGPALIMTAATVALLGLLLGVRVSLPAGSDERGDVRLLTCNIHRRQVDPYRLAAFIAATRPDVVALQDWSSAHDDALFTDGEWHVRREGELLVASRFPIVRVTPVAFNEPADAAAAANERGAAACFDLETPGGPVRLINVHFASPHSGLLTFMEDRGHKLDGNVARRWRESAAVRDVVEASTDPVLITGDFNTTDDSPIFREHWSDFADAFTDRGLGIGYTYLNRRTQLRIDHVMAGPAWQPVRCWVGPAVGSPHRPLVADLLLR